MLVLWVRAWILWVLSSCESSLRRTPWELCHVGTRQHLVGSMIYKTGYRLQLQTKIEIVITYVLSYESDTVFD